jgi:hypothetical protein
MLEAPFCVRIDVPSDLITLVRNLLGYRRFALAQAVARNARRTQASTGCIPARAPIRARNSGSVNAVPGNAKLPSCAIQ